LTYNLINRIAELHKKDKNISCAEVVRILRHEKHIKTTSAEFSRYANGVENPPKSELVLSEADKIVTGWEDANAETA
jgi:hypothetical protein